MARSAPRRTRLLLAAMEQTPACTCSRGGEVERREEGERTASPAFASSRGRRARVHRQGHHYHHYHHHHSSVRLKPCPKANPAWAATSTRLVDAAHLRYSHGASETAAMSLQSAWSTTSASPPARARMIPPNGRGLGSEAHSDPISPARDGPHRSRHQALGLSPAPVDLSPRSSTIPTLLVGTLCFTVSPALGDVQTLIFPPRQPSNASASATCSWSPWCRLVHLAESAQSGRVSGTHETPQTVPCPGGCLCFLLDALQLLCSPTATQYHYHGASASIRPADAQLQTARWPRILFRRYLIPAADSLVRRLESFVLVSR
ncbi:hypothetical protein K458DRAFT_392744 [Lentithecium fluviatile CBS 122367]|uniref:Uncharacterized protein n=1 Tax=Lentithecium fluviatile CBS 122367 TaxID=1168545 RepID=A0A6G1IRW4_9PLEO|nr:hypothetical protein K458DRAFT_392744 [Lentithecium fluviatile CBS 122367]